MGVIPFLVSVATASVVLVGLASLGQQWDTGGRTLQLVWTATVPVVDAIVIIVRCAVPTYKASGLWNCL